MSSVMPFEVVGCEGGEEGGAVGNKVGAGMEN